MIEISKNEKTFMDNSLFGIEDLAQICGKFSIGKLKRVCEHFNNTTNINILFETQNGKYVAKFFHTNTDRFKYIVNILQILHQNNVPVILPFQDINGDYFINIKGYAVQITPYLDAYGFNNEHRQMVSSGKTLRQLHTVLHDFDEISQPVGSIYPTPEILEEGLVRLKKLEGPISTEKISLIYNLHDKITGMWEIQSQGLPYTIIHGDWNERNQLYTEEGTVCGVLDFDFIQRKERLFDIAYVLWNFLLHSHFYLLAKPFMSGYGLLNEQEMNILQIAIARVSLFFVCTASLSKDYTAQINRQIDQQVPFINYVLSQEGKRKIDEVCGY